MIKKLFAVDANYEISITGGQLVLHNGCWKIIPGNVLGTTPLSSLIDEVENAVAAKLYHLAVMLALTLPDICGALASENGRTGPRQYKAWYEANLAKKFGAMTADDCYSLRCGVLHQGRLGLVGGEFKRVLFFPPESNLQVHNCIFNDALIFSVKLFCADVVNAVRVWFESAQSDVFVQRNLSNVVRLRPQGFAPYIVGAPVIG